MQSTAAVDLIYTAFGGVLLWLAWRHRRAFLIALLIAACLILAIILGPVGGSLVLILLLLGILVQLKWRLI